MIAETLGRVLSKLVRLSGAVAGALIGMMSLAVTYDVLARVLFNSPTSWALELATYAMVALVFLGSPYALANAQHVSVEVLLDRLPYKARLQLLRFALVVVALVSLVVIYHGSSLAARSYRLGLASPTLYIPIWLIQLTIPFGSLLMFGEAIRQFIEPVHHLAQPEPKKPLEGGAA
jgi:C4-dicarboxylate transporter DctQ subunit